MKAHVMKPGWRSRVGVVLDVFPHYPILELGISAGLLSLPDWIVPPNGAEPLVKNFHYIMPPLQFQPLPSQPTPSFWSAVNSLKLDRQGLDDSQLPISAWLEEGRQIVDRDASIGKGDRPKYTGVDGSVSLGAGAFGGEGER